MATLPDQVHKEEQLQSEYKRGRREQEIDSRFTAHDARFEAINGSIDRGARAQERLTEEITLVKKTFSEELGGIKSKLGEVVVKLETGEAVQAAVAKASVSRREFWLGVIAIAVVLFAALIQKGLIL